MLDTHNNNNNDNYNEGRDVQPPCVNKGFVCMPHDEFEKVLEKAAQKGAAIALADTDMIEVKNLLDAWRMAKATAWQTIIKIVTTLAFTLIGLGFYSKMSGK